LTRWSQRSFASPKNGVPKLPHRVVERFGMSSFVATVPDLMKAAAGDLASIRSRLSAASAAAVSSTTALEPAAADEVSAAISQLFGSYGQEFQALGAEASAFHAEFLSLLNGGAVAYLGTDFANAEQNLRNAVSAPAMLGNGGGAGQTVVAPGAAVADGP